MLQNANIYVVTLIVARLKGVWF